MKQYSPNLITIFIIIFFLILNTIQFTVSSTHVSRSIEIIDIYPNKNSLSVSVNTTITITFDGPIQNISNDSLIVEDDNGLFISGNISYNNTSFIVMFIPDNFLMYNTSYKITSNIGQKFSWSFRTESKIPIVFLYSPYDQSILTTTSPTLSWETNYLNFSYDIISYDIYISTDITKVASYDRSACIAKNFKNTSINVFTLNGLISYWTIIPHVDNNFGYCVSGIWSFSPDISPPYINLLSPKNHATLNTPFINLSWERDRAFSFDIYLSSNENLVNEHDELVSISKNQTDIFYEISGLSEGKTYFWTIVPYDGTYGFCRNGTWSFLIIIDSDQDSYNDTIEKIIGTDPFDNTSYPLDTDEDKILDYYDLDDDNDSLPDDWEIKFGLDPLNQSDAHIDTDNDGLTNKEEYDADTDPTDPDDHPEKVEDIDRNFVLYFSLLIIIIIILIIFAIRPKSKEKEKE